jgi:hypothetical protein
VFAEARCFTDADHALAGCGHSDGKEEVFGQKRRNAYVAENGGGERFQLTFETRSDSSDI